MKGLTLKSRCPGEASIFPRPMNLRKIFPYKCMFNFLMMKLAAPGCMYRGASGNISMADGNWIDEGCKNRCLCDRGTLMCMPMCAEPSPPSPTPLCPRPVVTKLRESDCCRVIACHDPKAGRF